MTPVDNLCAQLEAYRRLGQMAEQANGWKYPFLNMQDLLLKHGRLFRLSPRRPVKPRPRECFYRAYRLTQRRDSRWVYCEGYGVNGAGLAVHHAWAIRPDQPALAVELAWADATPDETAYIGIPFRREFVRETFHAGKRREYGVLDAWWMSHPILTGAIRLEDVAWRP